MLIFISVFVPIISVTVITLIRIYVIKSSSTSSANNPTNYAQLALRELHHFTLGLFLALVITMFSTNLLKYATSFHLKKYWLTDWLIGNYRNWAGRFRPDFLSRCLYDTMTKLCTGDATLINDGRKSFPSGHSSLSFTGCTYMSICKSIILLFHQLIFIYLLYFTDLCALFSVWNIQPLTSSTQPLIPGQPHDPPYTSYTHSNSNSYPRFGRAWQIVLPLLPLLLASYVAISRTQQYVHFPTDVIAGGVLGVVVAVGVYFTRFPNAPSTE
jgi:membrane-associated phospholipid phosphatase